MIGLNFKLNLGAWSNIFAVPSEVVDKYIKLASGNSLKVLLYMLRNADSSPDSMDIADALSINEDDVCDAITFWCEIGLFTKSEEGTVKQKPESKAVIHTQPIEELKSDRLELIRATALRDPYFSPVEISKELKDNEKLQFVFNCAEACFGKPLTSNEQNAIITIVNEIGLPCEVTCMLIQFANGIGKATPKYMKATAMDWVENGIVTIEKADQRISELYSKKTAESDLKKILGISRSLSKNEKEYAQKWFNEWGYSYELVAIAYDRCIDTIGKYNANYMNSIIEKWKEKNLTTEEMILADIELHKNQNEKESLKDFQKSSIDKDKLNKKWSGEN